MTEIQAIHECLFCSQTFNNAISKDEHILEHFAHETCTDCNRNLIRIGGNLYTKHDTSTCIKDDLNTRNRLEPNIADLPDRNDADEQYGMFNERPSNELWTQAHCSTVYMEPEIKIEIEPIEDSDGKSLCENTINEHDSMSCKFCGKHYIQKASLENHIQRVHRLIKITCPICKKQFENHEEHDLHRNKCVRKPRKTVGTGAFECEWCASRFHSKAYLNRHIRVKHDSNTSCYKCSSCYKSFLKESTFQSHNCRYRESCECGICGRKLKNWGTLKKHKILFHSSSSTIFCIVCAKLFATVDERDKHQLQCKLKKSMTVSRSGGGNTFECDICQKKVKTKGELRKHMSIKHHASDEAKLKCSTCGTIFMQEISLQNHKCKIRASRCLIPCETCGKVLTRGALSIHQIAFHSQPGTLYCRSCYKVFTTVEKLNSHIEQCKTKMNNERQSHCNVCNKTFASMKALVRHEISQHSSAGATGQLCKTCVKRFKTIEELNLHKEECRLKRKLRILKKKKQIPTVEKD